MPQDFLYLKTGKETKFKSICQGLLLMGMFKEKQIIFHELLPVCSVILDVKLKLMKLFEKLVLPLFLM